MKKIDDTQIIREPNFSQKVDDSYAILNTFRILSDIDIFQLSYKKQNISTETQTIFAGYQFLVELTLRAFIDSILLNHGFGLEDDFTLYRARFYGVELNEIPNTCEKTKVVRAISKYFKEIRRATSFTSLKVACDSFNEEIASVFWDYYKDVHVYPKLTLDKDKALNYMTLHWICLKLVYLPNGRPSAAFVPILKYKPLRTSYAELVCGYSMGIEFLWKKIDPDCPHFINEIHKSKYCPS